MKTYENYLQSEQWQAIRKERMRIDGYRCQGCGCKGSGLNPLEIHHFKYSDDVLYHEGKPENMNRQLVTLCRSCHILLHNIMNRVTDPETKRRGWKDDTRIPSVHEYGMFFYPVAEEEQE